MLVVNFYAGPGAGKSTMAASVFAELKYHGVNCELIREFIKDLVWEEAPAVDDQEWVYANQRRRLHIMRGKVDVAITDAPLLLSLVYHKSETPDVFKQLILAEYNSYNNFDVNVVRVKEFNPKGRMHNLEQAEEIDRTINKIISSAVPQGNMTVTGDRKGAGLVVTEVLKRLRRSV